MNLWMCVSQDGKAAVGSACVCRWCGLSIILKHFPELICETCKLWQFGMCVPKPGKLCTGRYWATPELWETCLPLRVKLWMWPFPSSHLLLGCGFSLETKKWSNTFWDHFVPGSEDTDSLCLEIPFGPRHCDLRFIPSTCSPLGCWPCIWPLAAQRLSGWACEVWRVCSTHESAQPLMLVKWKFKTTCTTLQRERLYIDIKIHICIYILYMYIPIPFFPPFLLKCNLMMSSGALEAECHGKCRCWEGPHSSRGAASEDVSSASPVELWNCQVIDTSMLGRELSIPGSPFCCFKLLERTCCVSCLSRYS